MGVVALVVAGLVGLAWQQAGLDLLSLVVVAVVVVVEVEGAIENEWNVSVTKQFRD